MSHPRRPVTKPLAEWIAVPAPIIILAVIQKYRPQAGIGTALALLGLVLCAGMVGLVRAANLDAVLPPGSEADARHRRRAACRQR